MFSTTRQDETVTVPLHPRVRTTPEEIQATVLFSLQLQILMLLSKIETTLHPGVVQARVLS